MPIDRFAAASIALVVLAAFGLRLAIAFLLPAIHHADETFQVLEPAHRMAFGTGVVTWEWRLGIRSWLLPSVFALVMRVTEDLGAGSSGYLAAIAVSMTLLSLSVVIVGGVIGARLQGAVGAIVTTTLCATWYEFIYYAPSVLPDAISAHVLVLAAYVGWVAHDNPSRGRLRLFGLLVGIVLCIRFQLAPALAFAAVYVCRLDLRQKWGAVAGGAALPIAVLAVTDLLTLGSPLQSIWWNLWVNLAEGRSESYGLGSSLYYVVRFFGSSPFASVAIAYLSLLYARRYTLFVGMIVVHVVAHSVIPHKEMRFLFPVMPLAIIVAGLGTTDLLSPLLRRGGSRWATAAGTVAALLFWCGLSYSTAVGDDFRANWGNGGEMLKAMERTALQPDYCGLGIIDRVWYLHGGYAYLHRSAQISLILDPSEIARASPSFNYAITRREMVPELKGFDVVRCWSANASDESRTPAIVQCLLHRQGGCTADPRYEFSTVLAQRGY